MRVFITGGSGWIGTAVVEELLGAGHELVALARFDESASTLELKGVEVLRGDLNDPGTLRRGALNPEAVVHLANKHNWSDTSISNRAERAAVQTIGDALVGTDRPFVLAARGVRHGGRPTRSSRPTDRLSSDWTHLAAAARTST